MTEGFSLNIQEAIDEYLLDCEGRNLSPRTLRWYREKLGRFRQYAQDEHGLSDINDVSSRHLREFLRYLRTKPAETGRNEIITGHTLAGYHQVLRSFLNFLRTEEIIDDNPISRVKTVKRPRSEIPAFTHAEVRRMLKVYSQRRTFLEHRNYLILMTLYDCALRLSELRNVMISDISFDEWTISVDGKGSKHRKVPMGRILRTEIREYIKRRNETLRMKGALDSGYLFVSETGNPLSPSYIYRGVVRRAGEKAGVKGKRVSPHSWRHTSALHFIAGGGDVFTLQRLLGHETLDMSRNYVNLAEQDIAQIHRRHSALDRLAD